MTADKLDRVATVARADTAEAARSLQQQQQTHGGHSSQLDQLQRFAEEYEQRLRDMAAAGMHAAQLQDYRRFLANLNEAIRLQLQAVADSATTLQQRRQDWMQQSLQTSTLEDFIARRQVLAREQAQRKEQREADDRFNSAPGGDPSC